MKPELMLLPVLAMVLLTAIVWARLYVTRMRALRARRIRPQQLTSRTAAAALLGDVAGPADNFSNLFEMPVLFYVLVVVLVVSGLADPLYLALAGFYAACRYVHSFIHVTYNRVVHRFAAYALSSVVLWLMWGRCAWQLLERLR